MGKFIDITGQIFGFLKVIERVPPPDILNHSKKVYWKCVCFYQSCEKNIIVTGGSLKSSNTISCGCFRSFYLQHKSPEETILAAAKDVYSRYSKDGLIFEDFLFLTKKPCEYCGLPADQSNCYNAFLAREYASNFSKEYGYFRYNGLDRINPNKGHILNNLLSCCLTCNKYKLDLSIEEFYKKIYNLNNVPQINIVKINHLNKLSDIFPYRTVKRKKNGNLILSKISAIKYTAKIRNHVMSLTDHQIAELITSPCSYCNSPADLPHLITNGIDRMNNNFGYLSDNSIPSCINCNIAKNNHTLEDFLAWIHRIKTFQAHKNNNSSIPIYQPSDLQAIIEASNSI